MPAHFFVLQDTFLQHVSARAQLMGLPGYGVARLSWDDALVAKGALSIDLLTVVFPSGELLDVPGNATISNLNLDQIPGNHADVYLHVLSQPQEVVASEVPGDEDTEPVTRLVHRIELSPRPWQDDARQSIKLVELKRELGGAWRLGRYIPPLLQVGTSPFLRSLMAEQERILAHLQMDLSLRLSDTFLGDEHAGRLRRGQAAAYRLSAFLADCQEQVHLHPYCLFSALRDFYVEVCLLHRVEPESPPPGYDHDDLAASFDRLTRLLGDLLNVAPMTSVRIPFVKEDYYFMASRLPDDLVQASNVYLVIQAPPGSEVSLDKVKLASPRRLEMVHSLALPGVTYREVTTPGFSHTFGTNARLYLLEQGEEWQHAVRERALCFYATKQLDGATAVLSWQT